MNIDQTQLPEGCPPLNSYYVYLTGECNLACKHCWLAPTFQRDGGTGGHLDYDLFILAIEEAMPLGLKTIKLTGGEPLLHPDFTRIVDFIAEKGLALIIETNGILITRSLSHYMKDRSMMSPHSISVSLDGAEADTHDSFRGVRGSFKSACQGIRYLVDVGYRPQVIMSLHKGNIGEIEALTHLAEGLGAGSVKLNIVQPLGRGSRMVKNGEALNVEELIEIGNWLERDMQTRSSIPLLFSWPMAFHTIRRLVDPMQGLCSVHNMLGILSTGHLAMCGIGVQVPELCYGMVGADRVFDVWTHTPAITDLRKKIPGDLEGICSRCIFQKRCKGLCVAENYFLNKRLTAPYWFCQLAEENELFPLSRLRTPDNKITSMKGNL